MLAKCQPEMARPGPGRREGLRLRRQVDGSAPVTEGQEGPPASALGVRLNGRSGQVTHGLRWLVRKPVRRGRGQPCPALLRWGDPSSFSASHHVPARLTVLSAEDEQMVELHRAAELLSQLSPRVRVRACGAPGGGDVARRWPVRIFLCGVGIMAGVGAFISGPFINGSWPNA